MKRLLGSLTVALVVLAWGCSGTDETGNGGPGGGASGASGYSGAAGYAGYGGYPGAGTGGTAGSAGAPPILKPDECDGEDFYPEPKRVAVMLLLDMSMSMTQEMGDKTKWDVAREAITGILTDPAYTSLGIHFGFDYFPDTSVVMSATTGRPVYGCGVDDPVAVDVATGSEPLIIDWLNAAEPAGATPLYCALNKFIDPTYAPGFAGVQMEKYLVLISDGADACGVGCDQVDWATVPQLEDVTSRLNTEVGLDTGGWAIRTIAIGFGNAIAPDELDAISRAGGVFEEHVDAVDPAALSQAFKTIANTVVSCVWDLKDPNAISDPDKINFYLDGGEAIPFLYPRERCATESGWIYTDDTRKTMEFCNDACAAVRGGTRTISARFGCDSLG